MRVIAADTAEKANASGCGDKKFLVPHPPSIEDFSIIKPISRGAFGKVYLARKKNNSSNKMFAVKVVKKADMINKNMVQQVQAERDALALSKSPFIVHLYYSLQSANNIYLIMEYLIGGDVKSLLHIYGYFDEEMAVKYTSEVALALDYLHRHGIIHRDLKPDNMLISNEGHIKLTDFGLSKVTLKRELSMMDILTTPSMAKPMRDYSRTPGQVLSLISSLGFYTPARGKMQAPVSPVTPKPAESTQGSFCTPVVMKKTDNSVNCSKLLIKCPDVQMSSPSMPVKCLTPNLLKFRTRFGTSSTSSQSHICLSSVESDCCSSPRWETGNQENEAPTHLSSSRLKNSLSDKVVGKKPKRNSLVQNLKTKELECAFSPIVNRSTSMKPGTRDETDYLGYTPLASQNAKGVLRKCLYENQAETPKENLDIDVKKVGKFYSSPTSPPWLTSCSVDPIKCNLGENSEKNGVKRAYECVEKSPDNHLQGKKSNAEYKRGCEISMVPRNPSTGLTRQIDALLLADLRSRAELDRDNKKRDNKNVTVSRTPEKLNLGNTVAKNLMCELNEYYEKDKTDGLRSDFDEMGISPRSACQDSDTSIPNMSLTEKEVERDVSDVEKSMKELSFEEPQSGRENDSMPEKLGITAVVEKEDTVYKCNEPVGEKFREPDEVCDTSTLARRLTNHKKPAVAFRSYNSTINGSNLSEPSKISIGSLDKINFSLLCTGSYPMAVTPAQKDQPYKGLMETPYRTPKSVRRGGPPAEMEKVLGTPDYLAPELLLGKSHGPAVDWWALGVCLFEFLTGIPPFNDETPTQVFQNILNRDIPWPEEEESLSVSAQGAIDILLTLDNTKRAGLKDLKAHPLFHGIGWEELHNQPMPFIPQPDDETDTTYFEARNNAQHLKVSGFSL